MKQMMSPSRNSEPTTLDVKRTPLFDRRLLRDDGGASSLHALGLDAGRTILSSTRIKAVLD